MMDEGVGSERSMRGKTTLWGLAAGLTILQSLAAGIAVEASTTTTPVPLNGNAAADNGDDLAPRATTDGSGNWIVVWHSNENLGGVTGGDNDVFLSRSTNNGSSWSPVAVLNVNAGTDAGADSFPDIVTDRNGAWVAVWESNDTLGGTIGTDWDILVSRSTNNGITWTAPLPLNATAGGDSRDDMHPSVSADGAGNWLAVWQSNEDLNGTIGQDFDILVSRSTDHAVTWSTPVPLNTNAAGDAGGDTYPQVVADQLGNWVAVWQSTDTLGDTVGSDSDIFVARSSNNGITWSVPAALNSNASTDSGSDVSPQVHTDGAGYWSAVWQSDDSLGTGLGADGDVLISRSTSNGASWTYPAPLNANAGTDSGADVAPQISMHVGGAWVAVWHSYEDLGGSLGSDSDILMARSFDNGENWSFPTPLNTTAASDSVEDLDPEIVTDAMGNWLTTWTGSVGSDRDIMYTNCAPPSDIDCDAVSDISDNCPGVANPGQTDGDVDGVGDRCDNCPSTSNGSQLNTDLTLSASGAGVNGDLFGDACDSDDDNDDFNDVIEAALGTNLLDNCMGSPGSGGDAWPLDNNVSGAANVVDVLAYKGKIPAPVDASHPKRLDLDNNNTLNVTDVLQYKGVLPKLCW